jgi:hypothetical protein
MFDALSSGRVETLFVHEDGGDQPEVIGSGTFESPQRRRVDRAVAEALSTAANIVVIPNIGELSDGAAATPRW